MHHIGVTRSWLGLQNIYVNIQLCYFLSGQVHVDALSAPQLPALSSSQLSRPGLAAVSTARGPGVTGPKYEPCTGPRNPQLPRKLPSCVIISPCFENWSLLLLSMCPLFTPTHESDRLTWSVWYVLLAANRKLIYFLATRNRFSVLFTVTVQFSYKWNKYQYSYSERNNVWWWRHY